MKPFKSIAVKPMTGLLDTLSSPDEIGFGGWRVVKNVVSRSSRDRQRSGGFRRLFADNVPFTNSDLHDQLVDQLFYYDAYTGHAMGGGGLSRYSYTYFSPPITQTSTMCSHRPADLTARLTSETFRPDSIMIAQSFTRRSDCRISTFLVS